MEQIHATTVICVRRDGVVAMAGDGKVTVGTTVMKHGAAKLRRLFHDKILAGFSGSAFALGLRAAVTQTVANAASSALTSSSM